MAAGGGISSGGVAVHLAVPEAETVSVGHCAQVTSLC